MKIPVLIAIIAAFRARLVDSWSMELKRAVQKAFSVATMSAALASAPAIAGATQDFSGDYNDPNHPNCLREIENIGKIATIHGTDGNPGCPVSGKGDEFDLLASVVGDEIQIDFSPKGGPKDVTAKWDSNGILFPDGNKWTVKD